MAAISRRSPAVEVEYDSRSQRKSKRFDNLQEARRFYAKKLLANRNPRVRKARA